MDTPITPIVVTALAITAVKGTNLRSVDRIRLDRDGVRENRRFYLIDARDRLVNGKVLGELTAIVADPRILVLDEATSNVDVHTESLIEHGLRRLVAGRTAIVIAHRLSTIRSAGRIIVLEHGQIIEQGTHDELLDAGGRYWQLYQDWAEQAAA